MLAGTCWSANSNSENYEGNQCQDNVFCACIASEMKTPP